MRGGKPKGQEGSVNCLVAGCIDHAIYAAYCRYA